MKTEISKYQQQAIDFAKKHGIKLFAIGEPKYRYFDDYDNQKRYVFKLKLTRNNKGYTFTFGQSISEGAKMPTMYDVLTCLTKYDPDTFEDFCSEFGYDIDSRRAEKTYKAVVKEWEALERLFGDIIEELQEIQ